MVLWLRKIAASTLVVVLTGVISGSSAAQEIVAASRGTTAPPSTRVASAAAPLLQLEPAASPLAPAAAPGLVAPPVLAPAAAAQPPAAADCAFCLFDDKVFSQDADFYVKPTKGMMDVEGYALLIPKAHVRAFGAMTAAEHEKFVKARAAVAEAIRRVYGDPLVFEHGVAGQTVFHAHAHFIPGISFDEMAAQTERLLCGGETPCALVKESVRPGDELEKKSAALSRAGGYLHITDPLSGRSLLFSVAPDPSLKMILRRAAAAVLGRPELADWKKSRETPEDEAADEALRDKTAGKLRAEVDLDQNKNSPEAAPRHAVIGVDIGGTHILAGALGVDSLGRIGSDILHSAEMPTVKAAAADFYRGIASLIESVAAEVRLKGIKVLPLVGIGQPGRFVAADGRRVIAPGSASNLGTRPDDFDGLDPEALLKSQLGPSWQIHVDNDAIAQMSEALHRFLEKDETAAILRGSKAAYLGPGTGLGGGFAEIGRDGSVSIYSDGHVYDLRLTENGRSLTSDAALKGIPIDGSPLTLRLPSEKLEDVLSGRAVRALSETVDRALVSEGRAPVFAPVLAEARERGYDGDSLGAKLLNVAVLGAKDRSPAVLRALPAARWIARFEGRMLGAAMASIYRGEIVKTTEAAQWPEADRLRAAGTRVFVIGGTLGTQGVMGRIMRREALASLAAAVPGVSFQILPITFGTKTSGLIGAGKFIPAESVSQGIEAAERP
jgi:diadenosine tetraphosphate (Ap4A) HIT family hydrolase